MIDIVPTDKMFTEFLPAERDIQEIVESKFHKFVAEPEIKELTNSIPNIFVILNDKRQIVYANDRLLEFMSTEDVFEIIGKRPGEALKCIYSSISEGGCGTTKFCTVCGAANSIQKGLKGKFSVEECRILAKDNVAYDLRVWSTPYKYDNDKYAIFAIEDISEEKRRGVLERLFFHDINNTASGIFGLAEFIANSKNEMTPEIKDLFLQASETLLEEINSQKQLIAAERNEYVPVLSQVNSQEILDFVVQFHKNNLLSQGKFFEIHEKVLNINFNTEQTLLLRILKNLIKNALEASSEGDIIKVNCFSEKDFVVFTVFNPSAMANDVKLQVFQRSFSTKGPNRGLGTYSIKLITERYLKGNISFKSEEGFGTEFKVSLPLNLQI